MTYKVGILGLASFYGPAFAQRAANRSDCEIVAATAIAEDESLAALARPTREAFGETYSCRVYDEVTPAALEVADAVVVATPTTRRAEDAQQALDCNVSVLCAKPAAARYDDVRQLAAAAANSDATVMFTTPARYDDAIQEVTDRVENEAVGDVIAVRAHIRHDRVPEAGINVNAEHAPNEAGAAYAMAVYTADVLLWLAADRPERVTAEYVNANTPHSDHPDLGTATVRFRDDTLGTMTMTYSTDCREAWGNWELEVVGTDGILRTTHQGYEGIHWHAGDPEERTATVFGRTTSPVLDRTFDAFVESIAGQRLHYMPDADHMAAALGLCEAWRVAADDGEYTFDAWPPTRIEEKS